MNYQKSTAIKTKHLGMSYGTACNRLKKILLFEAVKKLKENTCFKCNTTIETVEELSIEHKQPWLYEDTDLFWNLDNIAYSHLRCNRPDRPKLRLTLGSKVYCYSCKDF